MQSQLLELDVSAYIVTALKVFLLVVYPVISAGTKWDYSVQYVFNTCATTLLR